MEKFNNNKKIIHWTDIKTRHYWQTDNGGYVEGRDLEEDVGMHIYSKLLMTGTLIVKEESTRKSQPFGKLLPTSPRIEHKTRLCSTLKRIYSNTSGIGIEN